MTGAIMARQGSLASLISELCLVGPISVHFLAAHWLREALANTLAKYSTTRSSRSTRLNGARRVSNQREKRDLGQHGISPIKPGARAFSFSRVSPG